jgi:hypothetical protein
MVDHVGQRNSMPKLKLICSLPLRFLDWDFQLDNWVILHHLSAIKFDDDYWRKQLFHRHLQPKCLEQWTNLARPSILTVLRHQLSLRCTFCQETIHPILTDLTWRCNECQILLKPSPCFFHSRRSYSTIRSSQWTLTCNPSWRWNWI